MTKRQDNPWFVWSPHNYLTRTRNKRMTVKRWFWRWIF